MKQKERNEPVEPVHHQQGRLVRNQRFLLHNIFQAVVSVGPAWMHGQRRWLRNGYNFVCFSNQKDFAKNGRLMPGESELRRDFEGEVGKQR